MNNSVRSVWTLTDKGQTMTPSQVQLETKAWREGLKAKTGHEVSDTDDP